MIPLRRLVVLRAGMGQLEQHAVISSRGPVERLFVFNITKYFEV